MKKRLSSHVTLIELTAVLLIFMLASIVILGLFTAAYQRSVRAQQLTDGMTAARDVAARFAASETFGGALEELGARDNDGEYLLDIGGGMTAHLNVQYEQTEVGALASGVIAVLVEGDAVFELPVSRYYNKEVIHP